MANGSLRHFDRWSVLVILATLVLFLLALSVKGFTHDVLLEAGVFLVSVKLILMALKNAVFAERIEQRLCRIEHLLLANGEPKDCGD